MVVWHFEMIESEVLKLPNVSLPRFEDLSAQSLRDIETVSVDIQEQIYKAVPKIRISSCPS